MEEQLVSQPQKATWSELATMLGRKGCGWHAAWADVNLAVELYGAEKAYTGIYRLINESGNISWNDAFSDNKN